MKVIEAVEKIIACPYCDWPVLYVKGDACWRCQGCDEEWGPEEEGFEVEDWEDYL